MGYIDIWKQKCFGAAPRADKKGTNKAHFNFELYLLRIYINRNNSGTGRSIGVIFGYVMHFRGILHSLKANFRFFSNFRAKKCPKRSEKGYF